MYITYVFVFVYSATRAKMSMMSSMSKMRGGDKGPGYTQTEVILGESMQKFGRDLGDESCFGITSFAKMSYTMSALLALWAALPHIPQY